MAIKIGDFFKIPLKNSKFGIGYVIARNNPAYYLGALNEQFSDVDTFDPSFLKDVKNFGFFGSFFNTKLKNGDWETIGNLKPILDSYPFPIQKVKIGDKYILEKWDNSFIRNATLEDISFYDNPSNKAPMILQNAINASFELHEWDLKYEKVTTDYVTARSKIN